jgi:predicted DNA-binding transcriptional regulator AlpA
MEDPELLTERETAPLLRLTVKTLQSWRALKKGPRFVRVGRRVLYPRAEIEHFITTNTIQTVPCQRAADA